jgi:cell division protein FtsW
LLLAEPDLGTAITIVVMMGGVLVVSGAPTRLLMTAGGLCATLVLAAAWFEPYRRARLLSFLNPWSDVQGDGYQPVQAMLALGSGGIFGEGLGQSVSKANYLPEAHTDMIFAIIGEELGLVGATALIAAYAAFAYAGFRVALGCRDPFGKRLAAGITTLVCGQALINLAAVMGAAPLTGITLPFVSYGGSSLVVGLAAVGILLNIAGDDGRDRRTSRVPDRNRRNRRTRAAGAGGSRSAARSRRRRDVRRVPRAV